MAPRPSSRRISYLPIVLSSAIGPPRIALRWPDAHRKRQRRRRAGVAVSHRWSASLVLVVDVPHGFLDQPLHHGVERDPALLRLRDAEHRRGSRADLHLLLRIAIGDLLGGLGVDDLVTHADDPHSTRLARMHRTDADRGRGPAARTPAAEEPR